MYTYGYNNNSRQKFNIPEQCRDQPYEKEKKTQYMNENEVIDVFQNLEKQERQKRGQQMTQAEIDQLEYQRYLAEEAELNRVYPRDKMESAFDKFNQTMDRINQRRNIKNTMKEQDDFIATQKSNIPEKTKTSFDVNFREQDKGYTIFDGKINMILEPQDAEYAQHILENIQDYIKERHEEKKQMLEQKRDRLNKMQIDYMKDEDFKKKKVQMRLEPYEAKLVKEYLKQVNKKAKLQEDIENYQKTYQPYDFQRIHNVEKPQKAGEQDMEERIERLKNFKQQKRREDEKKKAKPKLAKKDFDLVESLSPNINIVNKFCNQEFSEKTAFYDQKKRNLPKEGYGEFEPELEYLQMFFETYFHPDDYILECDFYKKGVKINRDRQTEKENLIKVMENIEEDETIGFLKHSYRVQDKADIVDRLNRTKTIHPYYINFKEFVEFLYLNGDVERDTPENYQAMTEDLWHIRKREINHLEKKLEQEQSQMHSDGYNSDEEYQKKAKHFRKTSRSLDKLKRQNSITEYPIKITVPEPFPRAEQSHQQHKGKIQEREREKELKDTQEFFRYSSKQFRPKPIPEAVKDKNLWNQMQQEAYDRSEQRVQDSINKTLENERPFSFYKNDKNPIMRRKDEKKKIQDEKIHQLMDRKFQANPVAWTSTVNLYDKIREQDEIKRNEKIAARAVIMDRMADNQREEFKKQKNAEIQAKKKYPFKPAPRKKIPDFQQKQMEFYEELEKQKLGRQNTVVEPFNFEETRKATNRGYLDQENTKMKQVKEYPEIDKMEQARKITNSIPTYLPTTTKKAESMKAHRWQEKQKKLDKEIEELQAAKKRRDKKDKMAPLVWDSLKDDNFQRQKEEEDRKKNMEEGMAQQKQEYIDWKRERLEIASEQPMLFNREAQKGLRYPYNRIFQNYENIFQDTNEIHRMRNTPSLHGWGNKLKQEDIAQKAQDFVRSLATKTTNFLNLPYPWNMLLKDGETDVVLEIKKDLEINPWLPQHKDRHGRYYN